MRNICSFARIASKGTWRKFGKVFAYLVRLVCDGGRAFSNLDCAPAELHQSLLRLTTSGGTHAHVHSCVRCCSRMPAPTLVVADVPQAFEALSSDAVEDALSFVFAQARQHVATGTLSISKSKPYVIVCGGNPNEKYRDRDVIFLSTLERVVRLYLQLRLYRVGDTIWRQICGAAIGGPLSSAMLDAVCMHREYKFDQEHPARCSSLAAGRYADDIIIGSKLLCRACVVAEIPRVYGNAITFQSPDSPARTAGD